MKKITILFAFLLMIGTLAAQAPHYFKYQAIARNSVGELVPNQNIGIQIRIAQSTPTGNIVYSEEHNVVSNQFGLIDLNIGNGNTTSQGISQIDWSNGPYFLKIGMDITGGSNYLDMGTSQLLSVPYALYAETSGSGGSGQGIEVLSQSEINNLTPTIGMMVFNTTTNCMNFYNGSNWQELCGDIPCSPQPETALAGADQLIYGTSTTLQANSPTVPGVLGSWVLLSPADGLISENGNPLSSFSGSIGQTYFLVWSMSSVCGTETDTVEITFTDCNDYDACTEDYWDGSACVNNPIIASVAAAGADQHIYGTSTTLNGNTPFVGDGQWLILSGSGGAFANDTLPFTSFSGDIGETYELAWTINHLCGSSQDNVIVDFFDCDDDNPCTIDTYNPSTNDCNYQTIYPTIADAGGDQLIYGTTTVLNANPNDMQIVGEGQWEVLSGTGGVFVDENSKTSGFTGQTGQIYELEWSISNACDNSADTVVIEFFDCDDNNDCTTDIYNIIGNTCIYIPIQVSQAMAGGDQEVYGLTTFISATVPAQDEFGVWETISGSNLDIANANSAQTQITAQDTGYYTFQWSIYNNCDTTTDTLVVHFFSCDDGDPCTEDIFDTQAQTCYHTPIVPTVADAGLDQNDVQIQAQLAANVPVVGVGSWEVISGVNGSFSDSTDAASTFVGLAFGVYELVWTIEHECGTSSDTVTIAFGSNEFVCGNSLYDERDGQSYNTVDVNGVCWMAENLNHGTYIGKAIVQSDNGTIEKYCYLDAQYNCDTYGGIYRWDELMNYTTTESGQGICPDGWVVPSDAQWYAMENYLDPTVNDPSATGDRGTDAGTKIKENGSSGLDVLLGGTLWMPDNVYYGITQWGNYHTSTENGNNSWIRLYNTSVYANRQALTKELGAYVRCIKDSTTTTSCSPEPEQADAGYDQLEIEADSVQLAANTPLVGSGIWTSLSGGSFSNDTLATSMFYGLAGESYTLSWTISTICGSTSDTVLISFADSSQTQEPGFACGDSLIDTRDNQVYGTVEINGECWMAENLNYGTQVTLSSGQSDNGSVEKYCYGDDQANCDTYGGLYTWDEMMDYTTTESGTGICPSGWHIPSDAVWFAMESSLDPSVTDPNTNDVFRGTSLGTSLLVGGSSGLDIQMGGTVYQGTSFAGLNDFTNFFTSSEIANNYWNRLFASSNTGVNRVSLTKAFGAYVRCIQDTYSEPTCLPLPSQADAGADQLEIQADSTQLAAAVPSSGTGIWTSDVGGVFSDPSSATSMFYGIPGNEYQLTWMVSTICETTSDIVLISFADTSSQPQIECGTALLDTRDNQLYATVEIDDRCWMAENLNYGTMITPTTGQSDNSTIEKYCYDNSQSNCDTYGGLYLWDEMMDYTSTEESQGICPDGWHIPSDAEWYAMENFLDPTINDPDSVGPRGINIATKLVQGGSSGFAMQYSGTYYNIANQFYGIWTHSPMFGNYNTSTENGVNAWIRIINQSSTSVYRQADSKGLGNAVRCVEDYVPQPPCSPQPDQADAGSDILGVEGDWTVLSAQVPSSGTGVWTSSSGGTFTDPTSATSVFYGLPAQSYELTWTVSTICGSTSDGISVSFADTVPIPEFVCGNDLIDTRNNQAYATVEINGECWMAENLNIGTMVSSEDGTSNNNSIEKICYGDELVNCITYGGLYSWDEMMDYTTTEGGQGICPDGWHIPTDTEWYTIENYYDPSVNDPTATGARGTFIGAILKTGGNSGLDLVISGSCHTGTAEFYGIWGSTDDFGVYNTSTGSGTQNWIRIVNSASTLIREENLQSLANAVRCVQDPPCLPQPEADAGPDMLDVQINTVQLQAVTPTDGTGQWSSLSGGLFTNDTDPTTIFSGTPGQSYQLAWTVTNSCGSISDYMNVSFACVPEPSQADAGQDIVDVLETYTSLAANQPLAGTGMWSILSGIGGSFSNEYAHNAIFYGTTYETYELVWTISNNCGSTSDTVTVNFVCQAVSQANAGFDEFNIQTNSYTLAASQPQVGVGRWTIVSGENGSISDSTLNTGVLYGFSNQTYELVWTVTNHCDTTRDTVEVGFACIPGPSQANAGSNITVVNVDSVNLGAVVPTEGNGLWSIVSGTNGSFADATSPTTLFYGDLSQTYELKWTVSNLCGSSEDVLLVSFLNIPTAWQCGQTLVDSRDNQNYATVQIGNQCWMAENLNYGNMIQYTYPASASNNGTPEKFCYDDMVQWCDTLGGLYVWNELMGYVSVEGQQGLCPSGWHVPTDSEWFTLENFLDPTITDPTADGWRGTDIGAKLKENGSSGMDCLLGGYTYFAANFIGKGNDGRFFSSTNYPGQGWNIYARIIKASEVRAKRDLVTGTQNAASVRCIKD